MNNAQIAVIGDKDLILAFKAIGMHTFEANRAEQAEALIKKLAKEYAVIFLTENLAASLDELLQRYKSRTYPAIIPIPSSDGSSGYGIGGVSRDVEKAVGTDILNKD